jgi:hypothetical protein
MLFRGIKWQRGHAFGGHAPLVCAVSVVFNVMIILKCLNKMKFVE